MDMAMDWINCIIFADTCIAGTRSLIPNQSAKGLFILMISRRGIDAE